MEPTSVPDAVRPHATSKQAAQKMLDALVLAEDATSAGMTELGRQVDGQLIEMASQVISDDQPMGEKYSFNELEEREEPITSLSAPRRDGNAVSPLDARQQVNLRSKQPTPATMPPRRPSLGGTMQADQLEGNIDAGSIILVDHQSNQRVPTGSESSKDSSSPGSIATMLTDKARTRKAKDLRLQMLGQIKEETTIAEETGADPRWRKNKANLTMPSAHTSVLLKDSSKKTSSDNSMAREEPAEESEENYTEPDGDPESL